MKKSLFLRLCLILMVAVTAYSCRTDQFLEQENFNNSSKFQLTSKRISLNEAKHKVQLLPEIEKAETEMKAYSKNSAHGKNVDLGNGMTINTDNVIYMENGPNYHTYTFSIHRDNQLEDAPVENLVLTPLPEGGYKAYLVTYNFTEAEKNTILNGGNVSVNGKSSVTHLEGTFTSVMSIEQCTMQINDYYTTCSEGVHSEGQTKGCTATIKSQHVVTMTMVCQGGNSPQPGIEGPGEGGNTGEGGGTSPNPCSVNGIYINPQDPSNSSCNGGMATQPNLPLPTVDPCKKSKASITAANNILKSPNVQAKMDAILKGKTQAPNEWAVAVEQKPDGTYDASIAKEGTQFQSSPPTVLTPNTFIGDGHSHAGAPGKPSGGDLYEMLKALLTHTNFKYRYVYGDYFGVPENYALIVNDRNAAIAFLGQFPRSENYDEVEHIIRRDSPLGLEFYKAVKHYSEGRSENSAGEDYDANAIAMSYILDKFSAGINIAKTDLNGDLKKIVVNIQKITIPASGGVVKEGVKVSKCP